MPTRTILLAAAIAALVLVTRPIERPASAGEPAALPLEVYFSPGGGIEEALLRYIEASGQEILVAMYQFTNRDLARALAAAHKRGVKVMVLMDWEQRNVKWGQKSALLEAGLEIRFMRPEADQQQGFRKPKFHHKFAVFDQAALSTGSFNWTTQADEMNFENLMIARDRRAAAIYRKEFARLWEMATPDEE